ncbi:50S ribosomal protein L1 [Candidatus Peregrinibacteria bacterium CG_4_10_14_0_2_um_filter_43_11]|nr:MAG: 50S ribosomal protein L1 [Candidatus Peregrinibacteria bacterium CG_4_10_14_0_2_um_filter_43_11]
MPKRSKAYRAVAKKVHSEKHYTLSEGVSLLKETGVTKFDGTAELHIYLNIDPKKPDQALRGTLVFPHGTGKIYKIAAVVNDSLAKEAKAAGAISAGTEDLIAEFTKGKFDYDVIVATPDSMKHLGKVAKILGQKGLMPNPKSGTVTDNVVQTIEELKRGRVEYRNDKQGNVHVLFGKISFKQEELENNLKAILQVIRDARPAGVKGAYVKSITLASTMGPGIHLDVNETMSNL